MRTELKKAIIEYMLENINHHQLVNSTVAQFRAYIYTEKGDYLIGGEEVSEFISDIDKILKKY